MRVLLAATEALPYFKTGGLAYVARSLPDALRDRNLEVRIILPAYAASRIEGGSSERESDLRVPWPDGPVSAGCFLHHPGAQRAPAVLLEQPDFFAVTQPYGTFAESGATLARRFAFFSRAIVAYAARWGADVVHLNDWQTGLVPLFSQVDGGESATVFTIHILGYQGNFAPDVLPATGIPSEFYRTENGVEYHGHVSFMKAGIALADRLVTVSPTYAREIQTAPFGAGLDGLLRFRRRVLHGILNGINPEEWDPATDTALAAPYDETDLEGKDQNRASLFDELGLEDGGPLIVLITRLAYQKGLDLFLDAMPALLDQGVRVAVLGDGGEYHDALAYWQQRAPTRFAARIAFDDRLARLLYAGGDFMLMPSRYEPCGLGQLIAQRYGTPPIVRATGGLADTVEDGESGFAFAEASPSALAAVVERALATWRTAAWTPLRRRCMRIDHSWRRSARIYEQVYNLAIGRISA
ncbi:MAG: glycogen synthase [Gemmatimonadetes bacterium]|nr:glycogen synthase [Gemmatimonadota bacterium]